MIWAGVSVVALAAVVLSAAWPYLRLSVAASSGLTPEKRADWVNRLFVLAADADAADLPAVASAARGLVTALVGQPEPANRGR